MRGLKNTGVQLAGETLNKLSVRARMQIWMADHRICVRNALSKLPLFFHNAAWWDVPKPLSANTMASLLHRTSQAVLRTLSFKMCL
jgi:hypothetical protein